MALSPIDACETFEGNFTRPSSGCLLEVTRDCTERPALGSGMCEISMNCRDPDFWEASRRTKARRIGIEAAMTVTAGSAVPKIFRSTVVAVSVVVRQAREAHERYDSQLLSEISLREIILRNAMIPELHNTG